MDALQVEGTAKTIKKVHNLPQTDYYEPFEHAQPVVARKEKPKRAKINQKQQPVATADGEDVDGHGDGKGCDRRPSGTTSKPRNQ